MKQVTMHLDPKALDAARKEYGERFRTHNTQAECVEHAIRSYLSASIPAEIGELVERLETVKGEFDKTEEALERVSAQLHSETERADNAEIRASRAEAKLAGGEAVAQINAAIKSCYNADGSSKSREDEFIAGGLRTARQILSALTHPAPTHNDGSGEAVVEAYMKAADNSISEGILRGEPTPRAEYVRAGLEAALREGKQ